MCKRGSNIRKVLSSEREESELRQLFSQTERERELQRRLAAFRKRSSEELAEEFMAALENAK